MSYILNAFEVVTTYSIDRSYGEDQRATLLNEMGLNEASFFYDFYLFRPKEKEIKDAVLLTFQPILVYGFPGTGKTTVVRKVLNDLASNTIIFSFDFKGLDRISAYSNDFKIEKWHNDKLRAKINQYLYTSQIDDYQVLHFFFEERNRSHEMKPDFERIRRQLFNEYRNSLAEIDFYNWYKRKFEERKADLLEQAKIMISNLRNRDYLYFLANKNKELPIQCIVFYDNLDSITTNEVRQDFYRYIREYSGEVSHFAHIILTSRTSSIADQSLSDYGAHNWHKIQIDYQEFIDQKLFESRVESYKKNKGFCSPTDRLFIKVSLERAAMEAFAKSVIQRRTSFLEKVSQQPILMEKIDVSTLEKIKELYDIIIHNDHIHGALLQLSNHDRHWMFRHLVTFIRYIIEDIGISASDLGDSFPEKCFILESYFYHWTINNKKLECTIYDVVRDTEDWQKSHAGLGCSFPHLVIAVIYNLTDRERGKHTYTSKTSIGEVIEKLKELDYTETQIRSMIFRLYKDEDRYLGLLETSRYFNIEKVGDLLDEDGIWLTPRAAYICEYLSLKLLFMIALYRYNGIKDHEGNKFSYDDRNPISINNIFLHLNFLSKIAFMHFHALANIKSILNRADWFEYYRRWFCIKTHNHKAHDFGDLQLINILRSHILFLEHQRTIESFDYITPSIVYQFKRLEKTYETAIKNLTEGKNQEPEEIRSLLHGSINFKVLENSKRRD